MANPAEEIFGALFIQAFVATVLYGITTLQAFIYSQTCRKDPVVLKCYVAVIWILETIHTAFCIQFAYAYLVMILAGAFIALMVQSFYIRRVWILSDRNKYLAGFIAFFMFSIFGFALLFAAFCWMYPTWLALKMHISTAVTVLSLTSAVIVDVSIVFTLMWFLIRKRHGIPESTKTAVDWILLYLVNTGALTAASRIVSVILYTTQKDNLAFLGVQEIQGKLYANSFLGSLNTRSFIRRKAERHSSLETTRHHPTGATQQMFHRTGSTTDVSHDEFTQGTSTRTTKVDEIV
ncbi:hypothetical protein V8D89_012535 [Ganoderma adspersum]